ncbi:MgtC/SapB family protein [Treponema sp. C6A8]|uniref:MgtC/SapB family protein n=1 Tax=Treponema sp. C6A8 TaxID=1410609 RepID=UPI000686ECDF|nr:MgtC/SapB family protein [Treponema sp. C6A8]
MIDFHLQDTLFNHTIVIFLMRAFLSVFCGFCLGLERKIKKHPVGIRTLVFLSLSSCLFGITSITMAKQGIMTGDTTRIAAGVVSGIGFLGAGVIVHQGFNIHGLTTAAIIFMASALGLACADGLYIPVFITLALCLIVMTLIERLEYVLFPPETAKLVKIDFSDDNVDESEIEVIFKRCKLKLADKNYNYNIEGKTVSIAYKVYKPNKFDFSDFSQKIRQIKNVRAFSITQGDID